MHSSTYSRDPDRAAAVASWDRVAILSALAGMTVLAWVYLIWSASGMLDDPMGMVRLRTWDGADFLLMFLMWAIMMVGMMVPSAIPMTLIYAAVARKAASRGHTVAPTLVFVSGYLSMWAAFSVAAAVTQWGLEQTALLSPMMATTSPMIGGVLLVAAGAYQLTPYKDTCLQHCRSAVHFVAGHWRPGLGGAFQLGVRHGLYCLGCCWLLMALLFVLGVMNLMWIALLAIFVLLEKVVPRPTLVTRVSGLSLIVAGIAFLAAGF